MPHKSKNKPGNNNWRKIIRRWHRWIGYGSLVLVFILSLTGLILNHTEKLTLNRIMVSNDVISSLYSLSPPEELPVHYRRGKHWLSWLGTRLYLDGNFIGHSSEAPVGFARQDDLVIVGTKTRIFLYLPDGSLVETLDSSSLPGEINGFGQSEGGAVLIMTSSGNYLSDSDFISWKRLPDNFTFTPDRIREAPELITQKIVQDFRGQGITLYRLVLDLHSGHILGSFGTYLMDLAAISLIILGITGLIQHKRKDRQKRK